MTSTPERPPDGPRSDEPRGDESKVDEQRRHGGDAPSDQQDAASTGNMARVAIAFEGVLLVVAWALGELVERPALAAAQWSWPAVAWGLATAVLLLVMVIAVMKLPLAPVRQLREFCDEFLGGMFRGSTWGELFVVALLAGIGEEMLFRGVVQHGLAEAIGEPYGMWIGLGVGSLVFALAHYVSGTYAIIAGAIGLLLGLLLIWTGNLLAPIVAHAAYDFGAFMYLLAGETAAAKPSED